MEKVPIEVKIECPDTDGTWPQSPEWSDLPTGSPTHVSVKTESQSDSTKATENALLIRGTKEDDSDCDEVCPQPVFVAVKEEPVEEMGDVEIRENDVCLTLYTQRNMCEWAYQLLYPPMETHPAVPSVLAYSCTEAAFPENQGAVPNNTVSSYPEENTISTLKEEPESDSDGSCNEINRRPHMECSFETTSTGKAVGMSTQGHSLESSISFEHCKLQGKTSFAVESCPTAESQEKQVVGEEQSQSERVKREMQKSSMKCSFAKCKIGCREKSFECSTCKKQFAWKSSLDTHMRVHRGEKPFKCSQCEKSFSRKNCLTVHSRYHTGERPYKCSWCDKSFQESGTLTKHMRIHTGERPYKCSHCQKSFSQRNSLTDHMRSHSGEKPYKCSQCGKSFGSSSQLYMHRRVHISEKPYKCSNCEKSFRRNGELTVHMRSHTRERPFKCSQCEKSFLWNGELTVHMISHTGERPFKCSQCDKSFYREYSLTLHMRSHTGERPHYCSQCDESFSTKSNLTKHMEIHK